MALKEDRSTKEIPEEGITPSEGMNHLADVLQDPTTKANVINMLTAYGTDKSILMIKRGTLQEDLTNIVDEHASIALMNLLSSSGRSSATFINYVTEPSKRTVLSEILAKFGPIFAGFYSEYANDWIRINWKNFYDYTNSTAATEFTFLKNNGEKIIIESPFYNVVALLYFISQQVRFCAEANLQSETSPAMVEQLNSVKENVTAVLTKLYSLDQIDKK